MEKSFLIIAPPLNTSIPDQHDFIFIKEVDTINGDLYLGGGGGGAMSYTTFGTWGRGMKVTRYQNVILLTYLRSVLIFIKQYSDSMSFSSIFSLKLRLIPYLCEIDVRTPTSFWYLKKFIKFGIGVKTCINCSKMNSSIIWFPLLYRATPIFSKNGNWKLGQYVP